MSTDETDQITHIAGQIGKVRAEIVVISERLRGETERMAALKHDLKTLKGRLLELIDGPRKPGRAPSGAPKPVGDPRWPLGPHAQTQIAILRVLDDNGPMARKELVETIDEIGANAISVALAKLKGDGMVEKLANGAYALTDAQAALMRDGANS